MKNLVKGLNNLVKGDNRMVAGEAEQGVTGSERVVLLVLELSSIIST